MKPSPLGLRPFGVLFFALLAVLSVGAPGAQAQIQVTAADPPSAEQGTVNLNVKVTGKGFKKGAQAKWFVTGTTNPGGVTVNSTAFVSSTELTANITVADDATIANFDIQVQNADGRTGKGTELFSVVAKGTAPGQCVDIPVRLTVAPQIIGQGGISGDGLQIYSNPADPAFDGGTQYTDGVSAVYVKFQVCNGTNDLVINLRNAKSPVRYLNLDFSVQLAPPDTAGGAVDLTGQTLHQQGQNVNQMFNDALYSSGQFLTCSGAQLDPFSKTVTGGAIQFKDPALYDPVVPTCFDTTNAQLANQPLPTSHVIVQRVDACTWIVRPDLDSTGIWNRVGVAESLRGSKSVAAGQYHMPFAYRVEKLGCTP